MYILLNASDLQKVRTNSTSLKQVITAKKKKFWNIYITKITKMTKLKKNNKPSGIWPFMK